MMTLQTKLMTILVLLVGSLLWYVRTSYHALDPAPHETRPPVATLDPDDVVSAMRSGPPAPAPPPLAPKARRRPAHQTSLDPDDAYRAMKDR